MQCKKCGIVFDKIGIKMEIKTYFEMDIEEVLTSFNEMEDDTLEDLYSDNDTAISEDENKEIKIVPVCPNCRTELPFNVQRICKELIKDGSVVYDEEDEEYTVPDNTERTKIAYKITTDREDLVPIRPEDFQF